MILASDKRRNWAARALVGLVFFFNVQCALVFIFTPDLYSPGFEVDGVSGRLLVQGMGILFLMWNVPYALALINPMRWSTSLVEAVVMQAIGFFGETFLYANLPEGYFVLRQTAIRFILFDGGGLIALLAAWWLVSKKGRLLIV